MPGPCGTPSLSTLVCLGTHLPRPCLHHTSCPGRVRAPHPHCTEEPQLILLTDLSPGLPCPSRAGRNELGPVRLCCSTRIKPGPWAQVQGSMNEALGPFSQTLRTERRGPCARRQSPKSQVRSQPYVGSQACWDQTGPLRGGHSKPTPARPSPAPLSLPGPAPPWATCGPCRGLLPQAHHPWAHVPSPPCSLASQPWPAQALSPELLAPHNSPPGSCWDISPSSPRPSTLQG